MPVRLWFRAPETDSETHARIKNSAAAWVVFCCRRLLRMPRSIKEEQDILKMPAPSEPPRHTSRRIGIHTSTAGGPETAAERAYRLGCNAFQIFSSSPRQWKPTELAPQQCATMSRLREQYDLKPLVIHANYLVNLAGGNMEFYPKSVAAFQGEVQRGVALCAEYLVLHRGSLRGSTREEGLNRVVAGIATAVESVPHHENLT